MTPAGAHSYKKSLVLVADYEQLCREAAKIASGDAATLKLGYLRSYNSPEVHRALESFSEKYPAFLSSFCATATKICLLGCAPAVQIRS